MDFVPVFVLVLASDARLSNALLVPLWQHSMLSSLSDHFEATQ